MTDASNQQPEPFNLNSDDVAARKRADLKRLFPEVFNEDKIDLDQLRRVMGDWVDEGTERFGLTWPGKAACMKVIQAPATGALRPDRDESVNFDESENVFIEGDNLEVLKLLQKAYFGKIKMIYIDPPYNTGGEFIYPDKYDETLETYLTYTNQLDEEGRRFSTNAEDGGRFHTRWLNMVFPRLYLAKNLLSDSGMLFVSIGEGELANLRLVLDSIFGQENFVGMIARSQKGGGNKGTHLNPVLDYILVYARNIDELSSFTDHIDPKIYNKTETEGDKKGEKYAEVVIYMPNLDYRPNQRFTITAPDGARIIPPENKSFRWSKDRFEAEFAQGNVTFKRSENSKLLNEDGSKADWIPYQKRWFTESLEDEKARPNNLFTDFQNMKGSAELADLDIPFDYPKPATLIEHLMFISKVRGDDLVLDFFAGSGSTGHAVYAANAKDSQHRKFILVQLPEPVDEDSAEARKGYKNLAQIARERLRRAGAKFSIGANNNDSLDLGFRSFHLSPSSFRKWEMQSDVSADDLISHIEKEVQNTNFDDADYPLFELLLSDGFDLSTKVEQASIAGITVYSVADGALLICLERNLTKEIIDALADLAEEKNAARVVCLDAGFQGNDQLKTNAVQTFKSRLGHGEDGSMFRTV